MNQKIFLFKGAVMGALALDIIINKDKFLNKFFYFLDKAKAKLWKIGWVKKEKLLNLCF